MAVNEAAGGGIEMAQKLAKKVERRFRRGDCECVVESAANWKDYTRMVTEAVRKRPYAVVVFGGDGSVRMAASQTARIKGLLGIVPCGRFNNIYTSLYGEPDPEAALEIINGGQQTQIDAALANGQFFVGSLVTGVIPAFLERLGSGSLPRLSMSWTKLAARAAEDAIARPTTMKIDSFTYEVEPLVLGVHLLSTIMTLKVAPVADPIDGRLIVVFDPKGDRDTAARFIRDLRKRKYQFDDGVQLIRGRRFTMTPATGRAWLLDGDPVEFTREELTVEVLPQVVRIFTHASDKA
ncbi:MAG: diacylglycerol kinase family protein [candidate division Zixibacteria bacterium]|nr:diacylglycerol kinase family protein [candidate division Zixibacteria bacterium]